MGKHPWRPYNYKEPKLSKVDQLKFGKDPIEEKLKLQKKRTESRINEYFSKEVRKLILDCINGEYDDDGVSNVNTRVDIINNKLIQLGFTELGTGSNRTCLLKDGYAYKIALDRRGCIDNMSEYLRSIEEPRILAKAYETNRMITVSEYAPVISKEDADSSQAEIKSILQRLSTRYIFQDIGLTPKNYCNYGRRPNGDIVVIDYAYMYKISGNEHVMFCPSCGHRIGYNELYTGMQCMNMSCRMQFLTYEIINRMDRDIDDIDDETVIKIIGADDQGTNTSNFTYVKISGDDVGEINFISEEEANQIMAEESERNKAEQEFLQRNTIDFSDITVSDMESVEEDLPKVPEIRYRSEGITPLTSDELEALNDAIRSTHKSEEGEPLYQNIKLGGNES